MTPVLRAERGGYDGFVESHTAGLLSKITNYGALAPSLAIILALSIYPLSGNGPVN